MLSQKMEAFCLLFTGECQGNATESYKRAGYVAKSDTVASACGTRLLGNDRVKKRIEELNADLNASKIMSIEEMQVKLSELIKEEIKEEVVVIEGCGDGVSEARIIKKKASFKDITKAIETLGRMKGAFNNDQSNSVIIPVFVGDDDVED